MAIKTLVFDFGGVFLDLSIEQCVNNFQELGVHDAHHFLDPYVQNGLFLDLESGHVDADEFVEKLNRKYLLTCTKDDVFSCIRGIVKSIGEYKLDFVEQVLRPKGYKIYLLSNTNPYIYEWADSNDFLSNGKPISAYFDKTFCSYQMKVCKPDPRIFEMMIAETGLIPTETFFIDDGQANVKIASKMGFHTMMPKDGEDWRDALLQVLSE